MRRSSYRLNIQHLAMGRMQRQHQNGRTVRRSRPGQLGNRAGRSSAGQQAQQLCRTTGAINISFDLRWKSNFIDAHLGCPSFDATKLQVSRGVRLLRHADLLDPVAPFPDRRPGPQAPVRQRCEVNLEWCVPFA